MGEAGAEVDQSLLVQYREHTTSRGQRLAAATENSGWPWSEMERRWRPRGPTAMATKPLRGRLLSISELETRYGWNWKRARFTSQVTAGEGTQLQWPPIGID